MFNPPDYSNQLTEHYNNALPFPHIHYDFIFDPKDLDLVLDEVNRLEPLHWQNFISKNSKKQACEDFALFGQYTYALYQKLIGNEWLKFLKELTQIDSLYCNPAIGKAIGNVGLISQGGYLNIHADYNFVKTVKMYRRVNLLLYLNKDWRSEYGGTLELWDKDLTECVSYDPIFNRMIIFNTSDVAFHGHPKPINHPLGEARKSISIYYYSKEPPKETSLDGHSTLYQKL